MISNVEGGESVAQLLVRNLENSVKARLQRRAKRHGRSMEEEVRDILRAAEAKRRVPERRPGTQKSRDFSRHGLEKRFLKNCISKSSPQL